MALSDGAEFASLSYFEGEVFSLVSFFTADVGERPSLTWRGSLEPRGGLSQGLRKRIGNGLNTSIWGTSAFLLHRWVAFLRSAP